MNIIIRTPSVFAALVLCAMLSPIWLTAQDEGLLDLLPKEKQQKYPVTGAFKSSRVINNQSLEMIGKGVLDVRILHRFGLLKSGPSNFFGLDQANFRLGFDYGITDNFTMGIGRSSFQKELDGLVKWRLVQQSQGANSFPLSVIWVSGMTINTTPVPPGFEMKNISDRSGYYHEIVIGRKFNDIFSLQLSPILVHRNRVSSISADDLNDVLATGIGMRIRITRRISFLLDYDYVIRGLDKTVYSNPLGIGIDIETGGHVFQLHFSNSEGLNDNAFVTHTIRKWGKGEINFGFNLTRVFNTQKGSNE